ncbi:MAG: hypothetical protein ACI8PZ_000728 [Myxococcota bacterium]|jgi:hypothetical protein
MKLQLLLPPLLVGCVINGDRYRRPNELSPVWFVDRARVLAVQAEPPEIRPGQTASFEALLATPDSEEPYSVVWIACPADGGGIGFGCALDFADIDLTNATPDQLAALGFIGFEPLLPPVYTAPDDILDGLDDPARREGAYVLIQVTAIPPGALDEGRRGNPEIDFNEVEAAYKRLIVSEATTPNHNPVPGPFSVAGRTVAPGSIVHVDPDQPYKLALEIPTASVESYEFVNRDGEVEIRVEEPYVAWFSTDGEMAEEVTLYPYTAADWYSPSKRGAAGTWYAVVRDRRGGQGWHTQQWVVD